MKRSTKIRIRHRGTEQARLGSARISTASIEALSGLGGRLDRRRERTGLMCVRRVGKTRRLAVGDEAAIARLPVREIGAGLLPVDERGLVAPVVQARHSAPVRF